MSNQLQWILPTLLVLSTTRLSTCTSVDLAKIHEHMTEDELSATFNVKDKRAVPDYEVVPIVYQPNQAHRQRRSVQPGHHVVSIKNLTLYLEPSDHVLLGEDTPVYLATGNESRPSGIQYEEIENVWPESVSLYQDPENNAALLMYKESDGKVNFEGLIGDDTVVKPVPSRFKNSTSTHSHIVYSQKRSDRTIGSDSFFQKSYWSDRRQAVLPGIDVDIVYPEILVIVDYATYLAHNKDIKALCKYMAAFWNAVDLRFRTFRQTEVRLNIAGLIVATEEAGTPYMAKYRRRKKYLQSVETLEEVGKYLYQEERFAKDTYDVVIAITNYKLCSVEVQGRKIVCDPATLGISRLRGACLSTENPTDNGVTVMEDHRNFDGVFVAAHEIGHLLGAGHDMPYGPEFEQCHEDYRFLMAPSVDGSKNAFLWSDCSFILITYFLRTGAECLRNKPVVTRPIKKMLPGELLSRDKQCSVYKDMIACEDQREDECRMLYCQEPSNWLSWLTQSWSKRECVSTDRPVEGSSCKGGGMCLDGVCIHKASENTTASV